MKKVFAVLIIGFVLAGCTTTRPVYTEDKEYANKPGEAVVLVGIVGDDALQEMFAEDEKGNLHRFYIESWNRRVNRVYALSYPVGQSFKLVRIPIPDGPVYTRVYTFPTAHSIHIADAGIYPYGVIVVNNKEKKVAVSPKFPDAFLKSAQSTYPGMFKTLPLKK